MRVLLASSEVHPYSKTGGLADMVGALSRSLARRGHQVSLVTPLYAGIREKFPAIQPTSLTFSLPLGPGRVEGRAWKLPAAEHFEIYFIEQADFFERPSLYHIDGVDYPDNAARFIFFSKAAAHL